MPDNGHASTISTPPDFGSAITLRLMQSSESDPIFPKNLLRKALALEPQGRATWKEYSKAAAVVAAITAVGALVDLRVAPTNLGMLYLLGVVITSYKWGRGPAVLSSLIAVLTFDYFFIPPYMSFAVTDTWYLITAITLVCVALIVSLLTNTVRAHAFEASRREARATALYALTRALAASRQLGEVVKTAGDHMKAALGRDIAILVRSEGGELVTGFEPAGTCLDAAARATAGLVADVAVRTGQTGRQGAFLPLRTAAGVQGVMVLLPVGSQSGISGSEGMLWEAIASQLAAAVYRAKLEDKAREAEVLRKADELQRNLLNSVSHSLRAPLAAILSAVHPIAESADSGTVRELASVAQAEAYRLDAMISGLLDMSRLEAGALRLKREPHDIENVMGAALRHLQNPRSRQIRLHVPPQLPQISIDFPLIVNVLLNLLDNALKYSAEESPVDVGVELINNEIEIRIADRGCGVSADERQAIFGKFTRGSATSLTPGIGLGLPICKGFVEAHRGKIWMEERSGGGSVFCFTLPVFKAAA